MAITDEMKGEIWRKILHMGVIVFLPIAAVSKGLLILIIVILAVLYLVHESHVRKGGSVPIITQGIQRAKRLREKKVARAPFMMGIGVVVTIFIFPLNPASAGVLQLAFADMAAALVGLLWGRHKLPHSPEKSWEGSAGYFAVAFILMTYLYSIPASFILALTGAIIESLPYKDWDNLFIPVGVAAIASFF